MRSTTELWTYGTDLLADQAELVGYDVEATDGHIGKIDKASTEASRRYLVVDTGFWIFGKKRLIPAGVITRVDDEDRKVFVSMTKDQIKSAPDFDAAEVFAVDDVGDERGVDPEVARSRSVVGRGQPHRDTSLSVGRSASKLVRRPRRRLNEWQTLVT